jgi:membrane-associated phospholipid phosphatase
MALLDYHWLSDLVAGVAFGVLLLRILHLVFDGRLGRIGDGGWSSRPSPEPAESVPRDRVG